MSVVQLSTVADGSSGTMRHLHVTGALGWTSLGYWGGDCKLIMM
jgi:hypothetical protein